MQQKNVVLTGFLAILLILVVANVGIYCAKSAPRQNFPLAVAAAVACNDTSGVYVPVYSNLINVAGIAPGSSAHFIRVCDEITVTGVFNMNGAPIDVTKVSFVTLSLPVPLTVPATAEQPGLCMVFQSGITYPINGSVLTNGNGTMQIKWNPTAAHASKIVYHFVYTVK